MEELIQSDYINDFIVYNHEDLAEPKIKTAKNWEQSFSMFKKSILHLQWKASDVFMDFHCECGHTNKIFGDCMYTIKCEECNSEYSCSPYIEIIKLTGDI